MKTFHEVVSETNEALYNTDSGEVSNDSLETVESLRKSLAEWRKHAGVIAS